MELWQIALPFDDTADLRRLRARLRELRVPMDPCAGDPRFGTDASGRRMLLVIVTARVRDALREAGRPFEVVRDFADLPDPRKYVSRRNRYAEELARLRAAKRRR